MKPYRILIGILLLLLSPTRSNIVVAQNIIGWKVMIGADAPSFLAFPTEVDNARWDNNEMNDFFKFSTRNENTLQISYNGKAAPPTTGTGFSVIQGKNTHIFTLVFKKEYDINKDPVLYYDFSDKSKLKAAVEKIKNDRIQSENSTQEEPAIAVVDEKQEKEQAQFKRNEEDKRKKEMSLAQQQKKTEREQQQRAEAEKVKQEDKQREAAIAKAQQEAQQKEAEQKKAQAQEALLAKEKAEQIRRQTAETARVQQIKEEEDRKMVLAAAQAKDQASREKLAREQEEKQKAEQKRQADLAEKEKIQKEQQEQKALLAKQEAAARQKAHEEAQARLLVLQKEKEEAKKNAGYTLTGLWNRYGKKNINLYEIPPEQNNYNNTDFYVARDTLMNFENSAIFLAEPARLNIASETKNNITLSLQSISFKGPIAYYRLQVQNNGEEDYLVGANYLAWYNPDGSPKVYLKCSYLTDIGFFPLIKPGETRSYIYATRAANINDEDKLIFAINERRSDHPKFEIFFEGNIYNQELSRIAKALNAEQIKQTSAKENDKTGTKKDKKERKKARKDKEVAE